MALSAVDLGDAVVSLRMDTSGFDSALKTVESKISGLSSTIGGIFNGVGDALRKAGTAMTAAVTVPLVGAGKSVIEFGADFDVSMAKVKSVAKSSGEELELLRKRAMEMGETTVYTASEAAEAMYYMGLAGWDTQQIYKGIPGVLNLAAASGEDLATVSDIVTDALTAFGLTADDVDGFVNVLAETMRSSNTDVGKLGETFKYVAPVAGSFGFSIQDTALAAGIFANSGIKASQAGTSLRQAFVALTKPTDKAQELMDKYGVSLYTSTGKVKDLGTFINELRSIFGNLNIDVTDANGEFLEGEEIVARYGASLPQTEMEKFEAITRIFGTRALPGMLALIEATDDDFNRLRTSIYGADQAYEGLGTAMGMAKEQLDNLSGDWKLFTSALGTTKIILYDLVKDSLREFVQKLTEIVKAFNSLSPEMQMFIIKLGLVAAAIGPVLIILGTLFKAVGNIFNGFSVLTTIIAGGAGSVVHAFGLLGGAGGGIIGTVAQLIGTFVGGTLKTFIGFLGDLKKILMVNCDAFFSLVIKTREIRFAFNTLGSHIGTFITQHLGGLASKFSVVGEFMTTHFGGALSALGGMFGKLGAIITSPAGIVAALALLVAGFVKAYQQSEEVRTAIAQLWSVFKQLVAFILDAVGVVWKALKPVISLLVDTVADLIQILLPPLVNLIQSIVGLLGPLLQLLAPILELLGKLLSIVLKPLAEILKLIANLLTPLIDLLAKAADGIGGVVNKVLDFFGLVPKEADKFSTKTKEVVTSSFDTLQKDVGQSLDTTFGKIKDFGTNTIFTGQETAEGYKDNIWSGMEQVAGIFQIKTDESSDILSAFRDTASTTGEQTSRYYADGIETNSGKPVTVWNEVTGKSGTVIGDFEEEAAETGYETGKQYAENTDSEVSKLIVALEKNTMALMKTAMVFEKDLALTALDTGKGFRDGINKEASKVPDDTDSVMSESIMIVSKSQAGMTEAGRSAFQALGDGMRSKEKSITDYLWGFVSTVRNIMSFVRDPIGSVVGMVAGSHRNGLDYVPYDGYVAQLHQGERVLTKQEAREYDNGNTGGNGGDTFNFYNTKPDPYEYARQMKRAKKELAMG